MKKLIYPGFVAGVVLLVLSIVVLYGSVYIFPQIAEQYYNPIFSDAGGKRNFLFYVHPFILSFALAWFWDRFKGDFKGIFVIRGLELGLVYAVIAILPSMVMIFSAIKVSVGMVATWTVYGIMQGVVAGLVFAKTNP